MPTGPRNGVTSGLCWPYGSTVGNGEAMSPQLLPFLPAADDGDAVLPCDLLRAGLYRHGAPRWWCRTHQLYAGTKADLQALERTGEMRCAAHAQPVGYAANPYLLDLAQYAEVGVWCSLPAALSNLPVTAQPPRIHVKARHKSGETWDIDQDFAAISVRADGPQIVGVQPAKPVHITPPAAFAFVTALEQERAMDCVACRRCGSPHLDLGTFGVTAHKRHYCGNCGCDTTHSKGEIISTPLQPLHARASTHAGYETPATSLDLDQLQDCDFRVWASTPAILWTAARPQKRGIHVQVDRGGERLIDDVFGEVVHKGGRLDRPALFQLMAARSIV